MFTLSPSSLTPLGPSASLGLEVLPSPGPRSEFSRANVRERQSPVLSFSNDASANANARADVAHRLALSPSLPRSIRSDGTRAATPAPIIQSVPKDYHFSPSRAADTEAIGKGAKPKPPVRAKTRTKPRPKARYESRPSFHSATSTVRRPACTTPAPPEPTDKTLVERLNRLMAIIETLIEGFGSLRTPSGLYLSSLGVFRYRAEELLSVVGGKDKNIAQASFQASPSRPRSDKRTTTSFSPDSGLGLGAISEHGTHRAPCPAPSRRGFHSAPDRSVPASAQVDDLERDWWSSEVVAAWYGPRPRPRLDGSPFSIRPGLAASYSPPKSGSQQSQADRPKGSLGGKSGSEARACPKLDQSQSELSLQTADDRERGCFAAGGDGSDRVTHEEKHGRTDGITQSPEAGTSKEVQTRSRTSRAGSGMRRLKLGLPLGTSKWVGTDPVLRRDASWVGLNDE